MKTAKRTKTIREYYFSVKLKELKRMQDNGIGVINLGIGNPDLPPDQQVIEALIEAAIQPKSNGYQPYSGIVELRNAISGYYKRDYSVRVDPEGEVLPFMGSKEGITIISQTFIEPGDVVLVPDPGYPTYASASRFAGAEVIHYKLQAINDFQPDLEEIQSLTGKKVKLMWLNYPNMPTGTPPDEDVLKKLIKWAKEHNVILVNDNPYSRILCDSPFSIFQLEGADEVAMELNSLSKSHNMAGFRVGWAVAAREYINEMLRVKSNVDSGMYLPIQQATVTALSLDSDWFLKLNEVYAGRKLIVEDLLKTIGCEVKSGQQGMFVWGKIIGEKRSEELVDDILRSTGIFITPGTVFGRNGEGYIRASLCLDENTLKKALDLVREKQLKLML